jgi:hypothetical protein
MVVSAVINPKYSRFEIMGYSSPIINRVNHSSALAFDSLNLEVDISKLKFFNKIPFIIHYFS